MMPPESFLIERRPLELVIATYNSGKVREVAQALRYLPVTLRYLEDFSNVSTVDEIGNTYQENAVLKAVEYAKQTGACALADDSGLEVDAIGGKPGIFSALYAGEHASDGDRISRLLAELSRVPTADRGARFICCMALAGPQSTSSECSAEPNVLTVVEGRCEGFIAATPRGANGFGFDPVFVPAGYDQTFAQLPDKIKARISHRAQALIQIQSFIERWQGPA